MSEKKHDKKQQPKKNDMRDRMDRPAPPTDAVEGDEQTIDESLRQKEQKKRTA